MGNYGYEPIKKLKENNKKKLFFMFLTIFMFLGISLASIYFIYRYNDERENILTSGLVDIDFFEKSASINLEDTVPMTDARGKQNAPYIFTVENISRIPINLKIGLEIGTNTIDLSAIRYALYIDNEEVKVDNLANLTNGNLYIKEKFEVGAKIEVKLVFWIDYYYEESNRNFSGKIKVEGEQYDIIQETGAYKIIKTLVPYAESSKDTFEGGLVAVNTDGDLYDETDANQKIREYRYSGPNVNNYIYLQDNNNSNELWRIIGIFTDKDTSKKYIKVIRNELLPENYLPDTFKVDENTTYKIKVKEGSNAANWNRLEPSAEDENNNWEIAGLQYYLNREQDIDETSNGYLSYLSSKTKELLKTDVKYYLGSVSEFYDNAKDAYIHERTIEGCDKNVGPAENNTFGNVTSNTGCRVWANNAATWNGVVGLMYPSDYGYSAISKNWDKKLFNHDTSLETFSNSEISSTTWMYNTITDAKTKRSWIITPETSGNTAIAWSLTGGIGNCYVNKCDVIFVRPVLSLNENVQIASGDGTKDSPYTLRME